MPLKRCPTTPEFKGMGRAPLFSLCFHRRRFWGPFHSGYPNLGEVPPPPPGLHPLPTLCQSSHHVLLLTYKRPHCQGIVRGPGNSSCSHYTQGTLFELLHSLRPLSRLLSTAPPSGGSCKGGQSDTPRKRLIFVSPCLPLVPARFLPVLPDRVPTDYSI